jgi:hypothetical protein
MAKPPVRKTSELDEVERAISVLGGRHPEHERTRRETLAAAEERRKSLEQELAANARRRVRRILLSALASIALGAAGMFGWKFATRTSRIHDALAKEEAGFVAHGLEEIASNQLTARNALESIAPAESCVVALATSGTVAVHAAGATTTGGHSVGFCTCAGGPVTVEAVGAAEGATGLALLRIDGRLAGGPLARPWFPAQPDIWGPGGGECAEAMLDAWIADHRYSKPLLSGTELDSAGLGASAATLRADGFHVSTRLAEGTPFAVVESAAGDCELALASGGELSLRLTGGTRPIEHAHGAMIWCASLPDTVSVWATGGAPHVLILSAAGSRLGGLLGAREAARDAGHAIDDAAAWLRTEDQGWDATTILRASALADIAAIPLPSEPGSSDARITSIVAAASAAATWESHDAIPCEPSLATSGSVVEAVCAPTSAAKLWRKTDAPGAAARGAPPVWLSTLTQLSNSDAVARVPELLTLARRMTREGFEPTTFEGVTELKEGVRVVGRAGEDAIVAVGLAPKPPWVFPYSDGIPWDLGDAPRVIALKPGAAVMLAASPPPSAPLDKRRTVVFRHAVRP